MASSFNPKHSTDSYDNVPLTTHYPGARFWNYDRSGNYSSSTISFDPPKKEDDSIFRLELRTSGFSPTSLSQRLTALTSRGAPERQWKTTFLRFGPLSGVFCMLLAIASIVAALGILAGSNDAPVSSWITPPSTYLAIFAAIANLSVRYAAVQGVAVAWWCRASRPEGATLDKLHYNWLAGSSFHRALMAGRNMGLIGLACIFSTIVVIDGPLLQRASTVGMAHWAGESIPLNVTIAQELPRFYGNSFAAPREAVGSLYHWSYAFNNTLPTGNGGTASNNIYPVTFDNVMISKLGNLIREDAPLSEVVQGCSGTCTAKLRAPALAPRVCTSTMIPVDYRNIQYVKNAQLGNSEAVPLTWEMFFISIGLTFDETESLNLVTAYPEYADFDKCTGHLNMTACTFDSAIGEYTVQIVDGQATLLDADNPQIVALANNTAVNDVKALQNGTIGSTFAPIVYYGYEKFDSIAALYPSRTAKSSVITNGPGGSTVGQFEIGSNEGNGCNRYSDPKPFVVENLNKIMVWAGSVAASQNESYTSYLQTQMDSNLPFHSKIDGDLVGSHSVFRTGYAWFIAAALVEITCIAFIAPTYWGWWKLGREMSFSPLEVAKAFGAPMLDEYHSNSRGRHIAKAGDEKYLRYGVIDLDSSGDSKALAFADPASVTNPETGTRLSR